jgi:ABC-type transport system involved in Fe-S cluster assembly fused permease/ATPase subunit
MTTLSDVLRSVRDVVVMNDRVAQLTIRVDRLDASNTEMRDRMARMEAFFEVIRPVILGRALPAPDRD